eukprot:1997628-Pyramimonas_sp.AAC.1
MAEVQMCVEVKSYTWTGSSIVSHDNPTQEGRGRVEGKSYTWDGSRCALKENPTRGALKDNPTHDGRNSEVLNGNHTQGSGGQGQGSVEGKSYTWEGCIGALKENRTRGHGLISRWLIILHRRAGSGRALKDNPTQGGRDRDALKGNPTHGQGPEVR